MFLESTISPFQLAQIFEDVSLLILQKSITGINEIINWYLING